MPAGTQSAYQTFLAKMNQPDATALLRAMKIFVRNALAKKNMNVDTLAQETQAFFQQMEQAVVEHPLWAGCDAAELERACDDIEKFVMTKLHDSVFAVDAAEAQEDEQLQTWLTRLQFLRVEHLAISPEYRTHAPWLSAQQELAKISSYRTPRDKLVCILNCCKRINSALSQASAGGHGADEFFPVLLFVTLSAAPPGLHASLQYIVRFRHPSKLVSESAYYLTHMQSALTFLSNVQPEQLSIEAEEYERGLAESHAAIEAQKAQRLAAAAAEAAAAAAAVAEAEAAAAATEAAAAAAAAVVLAENGKRASAPLTTPPTASARAPTADGTPPPAAVSASPHLLASPLEGGSCLPLPPPCASAPTSAAADRSSAVDGGSAAASSAASSSAATPTSAVRLAARAAELADVVGACVLVEITVAGSESRVHEADVCGERYASAPDALISLRNCSLPPCASLG